MSFFSTIENLNYTEWVSLFFFLFYFFVLFWFLFLFCWFLVCFGLHFLQFLSYIFLFIYIHSPLCYFWVGLQLFWGNWKLTTFKMLKEYDVSKHYKIQSFCRMKMFITSLCSCNVLKRGYLHTYVIFLTEITH